MGPLTPRYIYKIISAPHWLAARADDLVPRAPVDQRDGFMHFSTARQLAETLTLYFAGQDNVRILALETATVADRLKWEPSRHGDLFPHFYGVFSKDQIAFDLSLDVPGEGKCTLPAQIV